MCAKAGRDTYRTFLTREIPHAARNPETRRITVPIRVLFGKGDFAVAPSFVAAETAKADDYTVETVDTSHFVVDERPDLVREKLIALAEETARLRREQTQMLHICRRVGYFCVCSSSNLVQLCGSG